MDCKIDIQPVECFLNVYPDTILCNTVKVLYLSNNNPECDLNIDINMFFDSILLGLNEPINIWKVIISYHNEYDDKFIMINSAQSKKVYSNFFTMLKSVCTINHYIKFSSNCTLYYTMYKIVGRLI